MQTLRDIAPFVALAGAALSLALLVIVLVLFNRVTKLRRAQTIVLGRHEERDIVGHVGDLDSQVRNMREAVEILTDELDDQRRHLNHALTKRGIVRYDAFRDAGGEQSASFALLDRHRSGIVLSAIAARDFARIYVKHLQDGVADRDLSPEEAQVIAMAVPRPLPPGDEGPRAARAPMPEESRPAEGGAGEPTAGEAPAVAPAGEALLRPEPGEPAGLAPAGEAAPAPRRPDDTAELPQREPRLAPDGPATPPNDARAHPDDPRPRPDDLRAHPDLRPSPPRETQTPAPDDTAEFTWDPPPERPRRDKGPEGD